jgi:hypothetical protein
MTDSEAIAAELERLRAENESLKEIVKLRTAVQDLRKEATQGLSMKVSGKGALSVYGLGRFPVTLYKEQWLRLLGMSDDIREFIRIHDDQLKSRG